MTKKRFYKLVMSFGYSPREARREVEECRKSGMPYVARFILILPELLLDRKIKSIRKTVAEILRNTRHIKVRRVEADDRGLRVDAEITDEGGGERGQG